MGVDAQVAAAYSTRPLSSAQLGEVSEWLKEHAWKVCIPQGIEGSNPSLTATNFKKPHSRQALRFFYAPYLRKRAVRGGGRALVGSYRVLRQLPEPATAFIPVAWSGYPSTFSRRPLILKTA